MVAVATQIFVFSVETIDRRRTERIKEERRFQWAP
jgi:hypothetical protein